MANSFSETCKEEPSSLLEAKSSWVGGGPETLGTRKSTEGCSTQPPAEVDAHSNGQTINSKSAAPQFELGVLSSTPEKKGQPPSGVYSYQQPSASPPPNGYNSGPFVVSADGEAIAEAEEEKPLSVWRKLCYAIGAIPYTFTQAAMGFYFVVFLLEVVKVCS